MATVEERAGRALRAAIALGLAKVTPSEDDLSFAFRRCATHSAALSSVARAILDIALDVVPGWPILPDSERQRALASLREASSLLGDIMRYLEKEYVEGEAEHV